MPRVLPSQFWEYCEAIYNSLTEDERDVLTDGCGAKDLFNVEQGPWYLRKTLQFFEFLGSVATFPSWLCKLLDRNCRIHDISFVVGGTIEHFKSSNQHFYLANKSSINTQISRWSKRIEASVWIRLGNFLIQRKGVVFWDLLDKPRTLEQVKIIAAGRLEERRIKNG